VQAAGFSYIEGWLDWFSTAERAERTKRLLAAHDLKLAGLYSGGAFLDKAQSSQTIETIVDMADRASDLGLFYINVNPHPLPQKARKTDEQLASQAAGLNALGQRLKTMGLQLVIHQHDPEMMHGAREHRYHLAHLNPSVVGYCFDTHWSYRGGEDPLAMLKAMGPTVVKALHLRNSVDGVWSESFGPGDVDYAAIADYLRSIGYDGWLVLELAYESETKLTREIMENHRLARQYLESVFLEPASQADK
jgi:inosose dehydratase